MSQAIDHSLEEIEISAQAVATFITKLIDCFREIPAFAPISTKTLIQGCSKHGSSQPQSDSSLVSFRLYHHLQTLGLKEELLETIRSYESQLFHPRLLIPSDYHLERDRQKLVYEILVPILSSLSYWYNQLDQYPATQGSFINEDQRKSTKPTVPIGMLSLSNYTDIACLIEFTVCSTILPNLEPNVLIPTSADDRSKFIPKTMGGRMPKRSLYWGYRVHQESLALDVPTAEGEEKRRIIQSKWELMDTTIAISQVILLDRFRHILFKRHISDLFAAIFQVDQYDYLHNNDEDDSLRRPYSTRAMWNQIKAYLIPSPRNASLDSSAFLFCDNIETIDYHARAQAYQSLLLGGKNSPKWLRSRVGPLLTQLALSNHEGLQAIIDVFVVATNNLPTEDTTGASNRLGQTLSRVHLPIANRADQDEVTMNYYKTLFRNICLILDIIGVNLSRKDYIYDVRAMATMQTIWSILDYASMDAVQRYFMPFLIEGLLPNPQSSWPIELQVTEERNLIEDSSQRIYRSLLRLYALLCFIPPVPPRQGDVASRFCQLLLCPLPLDILIVKQTEPSCLGDVTVLSVLLRIIHAGEKSILACREKDVAKVVFHFILAAVLKHSSFQSPVTEEVTAEKVLAVALVKSAILNSVDLEGWVFSSSTVGESVYLVYRKTYDDVSQHQADDLAIALISSITTAMQTENVSRTCEDHVENVLPTFSSLQWALFQLLLILYLQYTSSFHSTLLPKSLASLSNIPNVVILNLLSILCEKCQFEKIITEDSTNHSAIHILHLIISSAVNSCVKDTLGNCLAPYQFRINKSIDFSRCDLPLGFDGNKYLHNSFHSRTTNDKIKGTFYQGVLDGARDSDVPCVDLLIEDKLTITASDRTTDMSISLSTLDTSSSDIATRKANTREGKESMMSLLSIALTLLIAILELDSSNVDKAMLKSIVQSLAMIASPGFVDSSSDDDSPAIAHHSDLAEMASHAMALIASRENPDHNMKLENKNDYDELSIHDILCLKICDAAKDLSSKEAPLRAKGVVNLRHLVRSSLLEQLYIEASSNPTQKLSSIRKDYTQLFKDTTEDKNAAHESNNEAIGLIGDILKLTLISLNDTESYVYLAGIQTIVALADVMPYYMIPVLTNAICTGAVSFLTSNQPWHDELSSSQRVKVTEAMLFIIRRRGAAVNVHGKSVLQSIIYGRAIVPKIQVFDVHQSLERCALIQSSTYSYFHDESLASDETFQSINEEVNIRVAAGGPLFDVEESDLARSSCVQIVIELVLTLSPSITAQYCPSLCRLSLNTLSLDDSRVLRRAAALLCKSLYICASKEMDLIYQDTIPEFTISLVTCDENHLFAVLNRCVSGDDVDLLTQSSNATSTILNAVKGKARLYDEATAARCKEAIILRENLEELGFLDIARELAKSRAEDRDSNLLRLLGDIGRSTCNIKLPVKTK